MAGKFLNSTFRIFLDPDGGGFRLVTDDPKSAEQLWDEVFERNNEVLMVTYTGRDSTVHFTRLNAIGLPALVSDQ